MDGFQVGDAEKWVKEKMRADTGTVTKDALKEKSMHFNSIDIENVCIIRYMNETNPIEDQSFILSLIEHLYDECYRLKLRPSIMMTNRNNIDKVLSEVVNGDADGIIIVGMEVPEERIDVIKSFNFHGIPTVLLGYGMEGTNISCVNLANEQESYMAVEYLYQCGYREIGYLHSSEDQWGFHQRAIGFEQALRDFQICCPLKLEVVSTISSAYEEIKAWLKKNQPVPRAFFADNDNTALGAMKAFSEVGYRIPEDIALVGMDDIVYSAFSDCPLTTIHISRGQLAHEAVRSLLFFDEKSGVTRIYCRGRLVIRSSTRRFDASCEEAMILKKVDRGV